MSHERVFETILLLGVLGVGVLTLSGLPWVFRPSHSQSYPPPTLAATSTPSPTSTATTVPAQPTAMPSPTHSVLRMPTATPRSYPVPSRNPLPMRTATPRSYQPQPAPTEPPGPYPSRSAPASPLPWPAIRLGAIVLAALGIAGVAVGVRATRRRR